MSRIRVYELAKEAGISSKSLTDKLIEHGYDVKGHASTVDEETADMIRKDVLKLVNTELVEKRIDSDKGDSTVIRRRSKVVSRTKKEKDDAAAQPETGGDFGITADGIPATEKDKKDTVEDKYVAKIKDKKIVDEPSLTTSSKKSLPPKADIIDEGIMGPAVKKVAAAKTTQEKTVKEKPISKVVRVIELAKVEVKRPPQPKKKSSRLSQPRHLSSAPGKDQVVPEDDTGRGSKKDRKSASAKDDRSINLRRGARRPQKRVKFTHFSHDYHGRDGGRRGKKGRKAPKAVSPPSEMKASKKRFKVYDTIAIGELGQRMKVKASDVIAKLMDLGVMATINQTVDMETATIIAADFGYEVEQGVTEEIGMQRLYESEEGGKQQSRSPVVTVMGHVDHGKTSILDAIRKTDVADGESGGITQHIGAYHVQASSGDVTFVDTPGHAAFTEMRLRGAQLTDIVILVVAADDGVMAQTKEAINHAQAADVPIIVAINKIDKDNTDIDRVKRELSEQNLMAEDWGGETIYCEVSAKKNIGIDNLLDSIQLLTEMLELQADSGRKARGRVIEAQLHQGRGAVATVIIQDGTLKLGENFVVGQFSGKVRSMLDDKGRKIAEAGPSIPVEVQGLSGVPSAGDEFVVVTDEKMARNVSQVRSLKVRETDLSGNSKISLDKLFEQMSEGSVQELRVVLRSDVQGTLEAFAKAAEDLSTKEIKVKVLHEGTGTITESDILLASASDAVIIGFNVRPTIKVKDLALRENIDVRSYDVIYHALDDIRKAMVGMLAPTYEEEIIGLAEVREIFTVPKVGAIAGCLVVDGKILRATNIRVLRDGVVIYTGAIKSLRRFKDDVKEVISGYECGIGVEKFNDIKTGDTLEVFIMNEVEATLK